MSDGCTYELDTSLDYEQRLELVNQIIHKYKNEFLNFWEHKSVEQKHTTKTTLDILGTYLFLNSTKKLNREHNILTERQMRRRKNELELPFGLLNEQSESLLEDFNEKFKRKNPTKSDKLYSQSRMHKLNTIFIHPDKRKNYYYKEKPLGYNFYFHNQLGCEDVGKWKVEFFDFQNEVNVNVFTKEDLKLPYINPSLPYCSKWCYVDNDGAFDFYCFNYKIHKYKFDKILVLCQKQQRYFLDSNINLIDDSKVILEGITNCF